MTVTPFRIAVSDDVLHDLRARLARTRFTTASDPVRWAAGADPDYLRELVAYWSDGFDWRAAEAALNAYPQYLAEIDGAQHGPSTQRRVAGIWHTLMTSTLGYRRFGAFGGDIGSRVTQWLGALYPEAVAGIHLTSAVAPADFPAGPPTGSEQAFLDALGAYHAKDQGYAEIMSTRPDTPSDR